MSGIDYSLCPLTLRWLAQLAEAEADRQQRMSSIPGVGEIARNMAMERRCDAKKWRNWATRIEKRRGR